VISHYPGASVGLGSGFIRTAVWALMLAPAGLGFLTVLLNRDRRGLHDKLAGTRVVRAPAV
jgi:uncharacterized RDD family membrane protein YckC